MVHVLDLLGCVAVGPTTDDALAATPGAIRAYRRFLRRHGEAVDPDGPVAWRVVEHVIAGGMLGDGSPYIAFGPDLAPVSGEGVEECLRRLGSLSEELADWAATQTDDQLDATPIGSGRTGRAVLLHVLGAQGSFLAAALGGAPGFGKIRGAAERGEIGLAEALRQSADLAGERVRATTEAQRMGVRVLPSGSYTVRKALRRMLEHEWEHLAELARRPGGPVS